MLALYKLFMTQVMHASTSLADNIIVLAKCRLVDVPAGWGVHIPLIPMDPDRDCAVPVEPSQYIASMNSPTPMLPSAVSVNSTQLMN